MHLIYNGCQIWKRKITILLRRISATDSASTCCVRSDQGFKRCVYCLSWLSSVPKSVFPMMISDRLDGDGMHKIK